MLKSVSSRENPIIKTARALSGSKGRKKHGLYLAEGKRLVEDAFSCISDKITAYISTREFEDKNKDFIKALDNDGKIVYITDEKVFKEFSMTDTPQGIAALVELPDIPTVTEEEAKKLSYALILDGVSEPGNMGTIIRTAEAAGIDCVMLCDGCTDVYSPKTVRAAMGSVFRMSFRRASAEAAAMLRECGFTVAATALYDSVSINKVKISGKRAVVIGNEANGVSDKMLNAADVRIRIDMCGSVESLNAAVAAGIAMYALKPEN